jgi:toxin-antitoxin system PIN domain toxin
MKLPDVNLLLYAVDEQSVFHASASKWLEDCLSESEPFVFSWQVLLSFLRLSTHARIFAHPLKPDEAFDVIDAWLAQPCVSIIQPTDRHLTILKGLIKTAGTAGNLVQDAHLATLAIEHGATLYSLDADFSRFKGLTWRNPLK